MTKKPITNKRYTKKQLEAMAKDTVGMAEVLVNANNLILQNYLIIEELQGYISAVDRDQKQLERLVRKQGKLIEALRRPRSNRAR